MKRGIHKPNGRKMTTRDGKEIENTIREMPYNGSHFVEHRSHLNRERDNGIHNSNVRVRIEYMPQNTEYNV